MVQKVQKGFSFAASRITHHASRITHHASRITRHASRIIAAVAAFILLSAALDSEVHAQPSCPNDGRWGYPTWIGPFSATYTVDGCQFQVWYCLGYDTWTFTYNTMFVEEVDQLDPNCTPTASPQQVIHDVAQMLYLDPTNAVNANPRTGIPPCGQGFAPVIARLITAHCYELQFKTFHYGLFNITIPYFFECGGDHVCVERCELCKQTDASGNVTIVP